MWLGNVPKADRNDRGGRGRAFLVAYLPSVRYNPICYISLAVFSDYL